MEITVPISAGATLRLQDRVKNEAAFPTAHLQKGLILVKGENELVEEGVGFGVPLLKRGNQTIFPGNVELIDQRSAPESRITVKFTLNLEEKLASGGRRSINSPGLYDIKNSLAALIRQKPGTRAPLTIASNAIRRVFNWETIYEESEINLGVKVNYGFNTHTGVISIEVEAPDPSANGMTELILMNEQGARHFDKYKDASGIVLQGGEIGCWDEVTAEWAAFISEKNRLAFTLRQIMGAKLFRGRELIGSRLAWSGFGYSLPPNTTKIRHEIKIEEFG